MDTIAAPQRLRLIALRPDRGDLGDIVKPRTGNTPEDRRTGADRRKIDAAFERMAASPAEMARIGAQERRQGHRRDDR